MSSIFSFLDHNSIYVVLFILLVIWGGIFMFLLSTDKRLKKIESELNFKKDFDTTNENENSEGEI